MATNQRASMAGLLICCLSFSFFALLDTNVDKIESPRYVLGVFPPSVSLNFGAEMFVP